MNKLILVLIFVLLSAEMVLSSSLSISPSTLNLTNRREVFVKIFNSNDFEISVRASSKNYLIDSKPMQTLKIPANSFVSLTLSKQTCKDDYLIVEVVGSSLKQSNIFPSLKVKIHCGGVKTQTPIKHPDPFVGLIVVLSIVALSLFVRLLL